MRTAALAADAAELTFVAIGHRVVHGGPEFDRPTLIDDEGPRRSGTLRVACAAAPAEQPRADPPPAASASRRCRRSPVSTPPSTAAIAAIADRYAIPRALYDEGVRRYGFHGLSYEYVADRLREVAPESRTAASSSPISAAAPRCARIARRPQRREHDGLHRARRPADGHAPRPARSRRRALPSSREGHDAGRGVRISSTTNAA